MCTIHPSTSNADEWYIDSACSNHMTPREFINKVPPPGSSGVITGDNTSLEVEGKGSFTLQDSDGKS